MWPTRATGISIPSESRSYSLLRFGRFFFYMASDKAKQTNQVAWSAPPPTAATTALQGMVDSSGVDYQTPIRNSYARAQQQLSHSYNNPLGSYTTADVKEKSMRSQKMDLEQNMGMDLSEAGQQNNQGRFNRQAVVAGLTQPQMYNSSSSQKFTAGDAMAAGFSAGGSILS